MTFAIVGVLPNEDLRYAIGILPVDARVDIRILLEDVADEDEPAMTRVLQEHVQRLGLLLHVVGRHEERDEVRVEPREMTHVRRARRELFSLEELSKKRIELIGRGGQIRERGVVLPLPVPVDTRHARHWFEFAAERVHQRLHRRCHAGDFDRIVNVTDECPAVIVAQVNLARRAQVSIRHGHLKENFTAVTIRLPELFDLAVGHCEGILNAAVVVRSRAHLSVHPIDAQLLACLALSGEHLHTVVIEILLHDQFEALLHQHGLNGILLVVPSLIVQEPVGWWRRAR